MGRNKFEIRVHLNNCLISYELSFSSHIDCPDFRIKYILIFFEKVSDTKKNFLDITTKYFFFLQQLLFPYSKQKKIEPRKKMGKEEKFRTRKEKASKNTLFCHRKIFLRIRKHFRDFKSRGMPRLACLGLPLTAPLLLGSGCLPVYCSHPSSYSHTSPSRRLQVVPCWYLTVDMRLFFDKGLSDMQIITFGDVLGIIYAGEKKRPRHSGFPLITNYFG